MNPSQSKTALVVGAGIAGASVCYALSKQNIQTILLEQESGAAKKASGNPIGVVYPFLTKHKTPESEFSLLAFQYFLELWESLELGQRVPHVDGIHFLLDSNSAYDRYSHSLLSHCIPETLACLSKEPNSNLDALLFPKGKAVSPVLLTKELIRIANPLESYHTKLLSWEMSDANGNLICHTEKEILNVDYLFLTQGYQFFTDPKLEWIPMKQVRGQIVEIPSSMFQNQISILYGDYITAEIGGKRVLGASFDEFHLEEETRPKETFDLWNGLQSKLPNLLKNWEKIDIQNFDTRVSFRTQSQDRHPIVGKLPNLSRLDTSIKYQNLFRKNAKTFEIPYYETVGILNGLGSRGLTHALLAAEILVCDILSQSINISETIRKALKPDRFLLRKWKRDELT